MVKVVWQICCMRCSFECLPYEWQSGTSDGIFSYQSIPLGACVVVLCFEGEVDFCNKYMSSFLTNASPWTYAHLSFHFASFSYYHATFAGSMNPLFAFLKTATIPTYYGISIATPRYIAMQLSIVPLLWHTPSLSYCFLHDHVVGIVFVARPPS